jgi:Phosphodiester glycosidase
MASERRMSGSKSGAVYHSVKKIREMKPTNTNNMTSFSSTSRRKFFTSHETGTSATRRNEHCVVESDKRQTIMLRDVDVNETDKRMPRGNDTFRFGVALLLAMSVVAVSPAALAVDVWTEPNPGIRHLHRTTPAPAEFHALVIDLDAPGVHIRCTPLRERWKNTSTYARESGLAAAVNGGFWGLFGQGAQGMTAGNGQIWGSDDEELGFFAVSSNGRAWVSRPADVVEGSRRMITDAVSGRPMVVDRGHMSEELYTFPRTWTREPRTAVGVSENGRKVFLVTVDGRRATSHGGTLEEVSQLMIELGAFRAINLDGGGSTTMYLAAEGGVVNRPSRGWEREVVNHIGVVAPAPVAPPATTQHVVQTPATVVASAQHAQHTTAREAVEGTGLRNWVRARVGRFVAIDRLELGRNRELVVPAIFVSVLLLLGAVVAFVISRVRRSRARRRSVAVSS